MDLRSIPLKHTKPDIPTQIGNKNQQKSKNPKKPTQNPLQNQSIHTHNPLTNHLGLRKESRSEDPSRPGAPSEVHARRQPSLLPEVAILHRSLGPELRIQQQRRNSAQAIRLLRDLALRAQQTLRGCHQAQREQPNQAEGQNPPPQGGLLGEPYSRPDLPKGVRNGTEMVQKQPKRADSG